MNDDWLNTCEKLMDKIKVRAPAYEKWLHSQEALQGPFFDFRTYYKLACIYGKVNNRELDHVLCITGKPGLGKSFLALQIACVLDPSFDNSKICYNAIQFVQQVKDLPNGSVLIADEGINFLYSRKAMSKDNVTITSLFNLMRVKRLIVIICIPELRNLDSSLKGDRLDQVIQIRKQGTFYYYHTKRAIRKLLMNIDNPKKAYRNKISKKDFFPGHWNHKLPSKDGITWDSYNDQKMLNLNKTCDGYLDKFGVEKPKEEEKGLPEYISLKDASRMVPLESQTFVKWIKKKLVDGKKIGHKYFFDKKSFLDYIEQNYTHK